MLHALLFVFTKHEVVFLGTLLLAAFLVANGVYILTRGRIGPQVLKPPASGKILPYWSRLILASFYFALATGLVVLALQFRMSKLEGGEMTNLADIILVTLLLGVAVLGVLRPVIIIRWAKTAHPDIPEDDKTILWIARLIGVGTMGIALFILVIIVRR